MASKASENCRFCGCSFKVKYGTYLSSENLFKPSQRKDAFGAVLADICEEVGFKLERDSKYSERCCNPCARKVRNFKQLHIFFRKSINKTQDTTPVKSKERDSAKRRLETPDKSSPSWRKSKLPRTNMKSPLAKKSLILKDADENTNPSTLPTRDRQDDYLDSYLNVDELPQHGLQVKVVTRMTNGNVIVRIPRDEDSKNLVKQIAFTNWKTASKGIFAHKEMEPELKSELRKKIAKECEDYVKSGSLLSLSEPDEIAGFSNKIFMEEVRIFCPLWYHAVLGASDLKENDLKQQGKNANAAALASAALLRIRNSTLSAYHYIISTILFHSGARYEDLIRLNRLGVCMSPD